MHSVLSHKLVKLPIGQIQQGQMDAFYCVPNCGKKTIHGQPLGLAKPLICQSHEDFALRYGLVNVKKFGCFQQYCDRTIAARTLPSSRVCAYKRHAQAYMILLKNKAAPTECAHSKCTTLPSFGLPGKLEASKC